MQWLLSLYLTATHLWLFFVGPGPVRLVALMLWRRNASLAGGFAGRLCLCCCGFVWWFAIFTGTGQLRCVPPFSPLMSLSGPCHRALTAKVEEKKSEAAGSRSASASEAMISPKAADANKNPQNKKVFRDGRVVIEIFASSGRFTAALKATGVLSFGVDHKKVFFFCRRPLPFGGSPLEAYPWTSGESNHHRQFVRVAKNDALPTEPRGHLGWTTRS